MTDRNTNIGTWAITLLLIGFLAITHAQRLEIAPSDKQVVKFVNESYFVSCQSEQQMYWTDPRNGKVQSLGRSRVRTEQGVGLELYLNNITLDDAGTYTCITKTAQAQFTLNVVRPIMFDSRLAVQSAAEGRSYEMRCGAIGHSANLQTFWKIDQKPFLFVRDSNFQVQSNGNLLIKNVTRVDGRRSYACRAVDIQSPKPDTKTMNIELRVKMPPRPTSTQWVQSWGVLKSWANLTCSVIAEPVAKFHWFHRGGKLGNSDETLILNKPNENFSLLQVLLTNESKLGKYTCMAYNEMGSYNQTLNLLNGKKPPKPILKIESLGRNGVAIRVLNEIDPNRYHDPEDDDETASRVDLDITGYVVHLKLLNQGEWTQPDVNRTIYGFILRRLEPNTTYVIRAASRNRAAVGDFSQTLTFTTAKDKEFNPHPNEASTSGVSAPRIGILAFVYQFFKISMKCLL